MKRRHRLAASETGILKSRLVGAATWSIASSGVGQAASMVAALICARLLGVSDFGVFSLVVITVSVFSVFAVGGLGMTATRFISASRDRDPETAARFIGLTDFAVAAVTLPVCGVLIVAAPTISAVALGPAVETDVMFYAALMVMGSSCFTLYTAALSGFEAFKDIALANLLRAVLLIAPLALFGAEITVKFAIAVYGIGWLLAAIFARWRVLQIASRSGIHASYRPRKQDLAILVRFSLPALVAGAIFTPANWVAGILLTRTSGYAEMGVFNAANQWQTAMLFFATSLGNLALPMLSNAKGSGDQRQFVAILKTNLIVVTVATVSVALGISVAGPYIFKLYGSDFHEATVVLYVCALGAVFHAISTPVAHVMWSLGAANAALLTAAIRACLLIGLSAVLAGYGAVGLAWAYVLMNTLLLIVSAPYAVWLMRRANWAIREVPAEPSLPFPEGCQARAANTNQ